MSGPELVVRGGREVDSLPADSAALDDSPGYFWPRPASSVHIGDRRPLTYSKAVSELLDPKASNVLSKADHCSAIYTHRVATQALSDTEAAIGNITLKTHNVSVSKYSDTSIIRGVQALDASKRLQAALDAAGWTIRELASNTGWVDGKPAPEQPEGAMSPSRIGNYLQGTRPIGQSEADVFARVFDVVATWFLGATDKTESTVLGSLRGHKGEIHEPRETGRHEVTHEQATKRRRHKR
jgi:transcriptional regulator with XRE-family HTH domain